MSAPIRSHQVAARKAARSVIAAAAAPLLLCGSLHAEQAASTAAAITETTNTEATNTEATNTEASSTDASSVPMDDVIVSVQKQTALDSEAISLSATPDAEPHLENGTSILVGLGALSSPVYDGAKKSKVSPFPYIDIHGWFHDRVYVSTVRGLGVNVVDTGPFRAGLAVNYAGGRTSSDSDRLRGLPNISGAPSLRGFVTYAIKPFTFEASVGHEFGSNPATEAALGASVGFAPMARLHLSVGADLTWVNSQFNRKFYGITPQEAAQANAAGNPLTAYAPGSGLSRVQLTSTGVYALTPHWGIISRLGLSDIIGSQEKNSPLVERAFGVSFGIGAAYKF